MSKDWVFKRHIRIAEDQIRKLPRKSRKPPRTEGRTKENKEFGEALKFQLESAVNYCRRPGKLVDEDFLFILRTANKINFEDQMLNRLGLKLALQMGENSAIVSISNEMLEELRKIVSRYIETAELRSSINEIDSISPVDFNRVSPEISEWINTSDTSLFLEIELLPNLGEERYWSIVNGLTSFLKNQEGDFVNSRVREHGASIRASLKPQTAKAITNGVDSVWQARRAPEIVVARPQSLVLKEEITAGVPESNAKPICVLDTGVDRSHPFLKDVVIDAVDLTQDEREQDLDGHGTFVAGLAAYGELENRTDPSASARIISAKVLGKDPVYVPYLETRIEEAVERFHEYAKIFSMSIMYPKYCNFAQPSELAYTIDRLSREKGVLFVVCTGNLEEELRTLKALPYPMYFGDKSCIVYDGAEASASVTVGGLANKESDKSVARIREPSPFTRRGDLSSRGKPDVVSSAGNAERASDSGLLRPNPRLGVISLGLTPSTFAYDYGTSCSAPLAANLLARIQAEYPEAGPNLLKALLIHFAHLPEESLRLNLSDPLKRAVYGKGLPDFYRCAYSTKSCATFILEDSLAHNEIAFIPLYVPKVMKQIYGEKIMRVTLVYDPPVDRGILGYTLVDLDFKLYKQSKQSQEPKIQRNWDGVYRRPWDNVKTDIFRWQKAGWGKEWLVMIYPKLRFKKKSTELDESGQKFALVVTLEDPKNKVDIYNAITNERKKITKTLEAYIQSKKRPLINATR